MLDEFLGTRRLGSWYPVIDFQHEWDLNESTHWSEISGPLFQMAQPSSDAIPQLDQCWPSGHWKNGRFFYNSAVNNITNVSVTNVYSKPVARLKGKKNKCCLPPYLFVMSDPLTSALYRSIGVRLRKRPNIRSLPGPMTFIHLFRPAHRAPRLLSCSSNGDGDVAKLFWIF